MSIINEIHNQAQELCEADLDEWVVPKLIEHYSTRIKSLAKYAYSERSETADGVALAYAAFKERAKAEIRDGVFTFLFVSEHWRNNRDINSYLQLCLKRLAAKIRSDVEASRKTSIPICPSCKDLGHRQFLKYDGKLLRCDACASEISRLEDELKKPALDQGERDRISGELRLRKIFFLHSKKGYRCPDCHRFVPDTFVQQYGVSCPYPNCCFFGTVGELDIMNHPLGLSSDMPLSLNQPIFKVEECGKAPIAWQDRFEAKDISADISLEIKESCVSKLEVLKQVIKEQVASIKRNEPEERSILKLLMYEAYSNLVKRQPDDMIHYLVHMKHSGELPLQAMIFQEFVHLVENSLPFNLARGKKIVEICSLLDPNLQLFLGRSEFDATVRTNHIIPNNTVETYTGGRKLKFFGPCFIGFLIDVIDRDTNESLMSKIKNYSFVQIKLEDSVKAGTPVHVSHFRIPSHYEMGGLVYLQRIRRSIVDSVYFRLNKKKRIIKKKRKK